LARQREADCQQVCEIANFLMIKIIFINMAKNAFHEGAFFSAIREDFPLWAGLIRL